MAESSFQRGFGGGCGLVLGICLALALIPTVIVGGCLLGVGSCAMLIPAAHQAREAAERARLAHEQMQPREEATDATGFDESEPSADPLDVPVDSEPEVSDAIETDLAVKKGMEPAVEQQQAFVEKSGPVEDAEPGGEGMSPEPAPAEAPAVGVSEFRIWRDASGKFEVEAELVSLTMGQVRLRKRDGTNVVVAKERLSEADQAWLAQEFKRRKTRRP